VPRLNVRTTLPLLLLVAALAGCAKNGSEPSNSITNPTGSPSGGAAVEEAAVAATLSGTPELIEDGLMESEAETDLAASAIAGDMGSALIRPLRFWRRIENVERRFEFAFADTDTTGRPTTVIVTAHKRMLGSFNILAGRPAGEPVVDAAGEEGTPPRDTTLRLVRKRLDDHWVRRVLLKRVPPPPPGDGEVANADRRVMWRVAATSGVKVTSRDARTNIRGVRVQAGPLDTTITNPLELFRLRRMLHLPADARVMLTVTTDRNDDVVVLYRGDGRFRFRNNGDNTYSGGFHTGWLRGVHHFGVNALSHGTLFDDAAPYDSEAWAFPYVVAPTLMAELVP